MTQNRTADFQGSISDAGSTPKFLDGLYNLKKEPETEGFEKHNELVDKDVGDNGLCIKIEEKYLKSEYLVDEGDSCFDTRSLDVRLGKILSAS